MRTKVEIDEELIKEVQELSGHALLHSDRDFEPMERYLGLQTV